MMVIAKDGAQGPARSRKGLIVLAILSICVIAGLVVWASRSSSSSKSNLGPQAKVLAAVTQEAAFSYSLRAAVTAEDEARTLAITDMAQALDLSIIVPGTPGALPTSAVTTGTASPELTRARVSWAKDHVDEVAMHDELYLLPSSRNAALSYLGFPTAARLAKRWSSIATSLQAAAGSVNTASYENLLNSIGLGPAASPKVKHFKKVHWEGRTLLSFSTQIRSSSMTCGMGEAHWLATTYVDPKSFLPVVAVLQGDGPFNPPNNPSTAGVLRATSTIRFSKWGKAPEALQPVKPLAIDLEVQRSMKRGMQSAAYAAIAP